MKPIDLSLASIEKAARVIDPLFRDSPQFEDEQLNAALKRRVLVKVETANPIRSFKGRGADFRAQSLERGWHVVCASAGNFGQAVAYAGRSRGLSVTVFAPEDVNPMKLQRMRAFGADVRLVGIDCDEAKGHARSFVGESSNRVFVEDGNDPEISEGAGTIGVELLKSGELDTVVLPVGDGALIAGVALWLKAHAKATRIVGVCAKGAPAMVESWRAASPRASARTQTIADGLAARVPVRRSLTRLCALVDDMMLVDDGALIEAMRLAVRTLGQVLEPSGAAGLAAIASGAVAGDRIATVLTGSNLNPGLAAEARLFG